uniref:Uncharacterized protein n=1 Tax=Knipowitschia caucasica TaxID=637954 RepID=A0AAV2K248_KNICA
MDVVGGKMTDNGRLCAFITKVKKGSLADTVGHLRPGDQVLQWNGCLLQGSTFNQVYDIIQDSQHQQQVQLLVQRDLGPEEGAAVELGDHSRRRTKTVRKTTEPRWAQTFIFGPVLLRDLTDRTLEVTVWDQNRVQDQIYGQDQAYGQEEENQLLGQMISSLKSVESNCGDDVDPQALSSRASVDLGAAPEQPAEVTSPAVGGATLQKSESIEGDEEEEEPNLIFPGVKIAADKNFTGFLDNLGPAQVAGRQTLATPSMAAYVKVYLMDNGKCVLKRRTRLSRKTLDPLYQQQLQFEENPEGKVLQVIVWGDYGRMDHKSFMGAAQILLDDLDLSNMVLGWFKLFPAISLVDPGLAPLTNKETEGAKAFITPTPVAPATPAKT